MLPRVLWIEDGAENELFNMLAPIYVSGRYDLEIAKDATQAVDKLASSSFEAVVVDIRLPPGHSRQWVDVYAQYHTNPDSARLGLHLLRALFAPAKTPIVLSNVSGGWYTETRFAVFSVETDLTSEIEELGIEIHEEKGARTPRRRVLEIIERVLEANRTV